MSLKQKFEDYFMEFKSVVKIADFLWDFENVSNDLEDMTPEHLAFLKENVFDSSLLVLLNDLDSEPQEEVFPEMLEELKSMIHTPKTKSELISQFLENKEGLSWFMKASVQFYAKEGFVSGNFRKQLEDMMDAYKKGV